MDKPKQKTGYQWAIETKNTFMDVAFPQLDLTHTEAYVWLYLHCHTNWKTGMVSLSYTLLQERTRLSRSQIIRIIKSLRDQRMLCRIKTGTRFGHKSKYAVCWEPGEMHPVAKKEWKAELARRRNATT